MRFQDVIFFMFVLILIGLLVRYGKAATQILTATFSGVIGLTKQLQMA